MLSDHPKRALAKNQASSEITKSGLFESWKDGKVRMFRFRRPKA